MQSAELKNSRRLSIGIQWVAVLAVVALGVLVAALPFLPPITQHPHQNYESVRRSTQMRSICQGLLIYAKNHRDNFPDQGEWQDVLISTGLIEAGLVVSPLSDGGEASYILAARSNSFDPTELMLYENPKHDPEGVLMAYMDGRVELLDHDVFEQMLAAQLAKDPQP